MTSISLVDMIQHSLTEEHLDFLGWPYACILAASLFTWIVFYYGLKRRWPEHKSEWHCRIVTLIHGLLICSLSIVILFVVDWRVPFLPENQGRASTHLMQFTFSISLAYFIFDLCWCLAHNSEGAMMLFHHICTILGYSVALYVGRWGTELTATIVGTELSNPLLQTRWFVRNSGLRDSSLARLIDLLFIGSFGFNRLGLGSYFLYTYLSNPATDFLGRLGAVVIYTIGWMFWLSIVAYGYRKYLCQQPSHCAAALTPPRPEGDTGGGRTLTTAKGAGKLANGIKSTSARDGVVYRSVPSDEVAQDYPGKMPSSNSGSHSNGSVH